MNGPVLGETDGGDDGGLRLFLLLLLLLLFFFGSVSIFLNLFNRF